MATKVTKPMKREVEVSGQPCTLTIDEGGIKLTKKGHRNGSEISYEALQKGEAPTVTK